MTSKLQKYVTLITLITILPFNIIAHAQTPSVEENELSAVFACRAETDPEKRLACYDLAVGRFEEAQEKGEIVTISKKQVEEVERDSFGFNLPSLPKLGNLFGNKPKRPKTKDSDLTAPVETQRSAEATLPKEPTQPPTIDKPRIKEIEIPIKSTQNFGYNKTRFFLENGQVWEQVDSLKVRIPKIKDGNKPTAKIKKASLGSFMLRVNGKGKAIRVRRVR